MPITNLGKAVKLYKDPDVVQYLGGKTNTLCKKTNSCNTIYINVKNNYTDGKAINLLANPDATFIDTLEKVFGKEGIMQLLAKSVLSTSTSGDKIYNFSQISNIIAIAYYLWKATWTTNPTRTLTSEAELNRILKNIAKDTGDIQKKLNYLKDLQTDYDEEQLKTQTTDEKNENEINGNDIDNIFRKLTYVLLMCDGSLTNTNMVAKKLQSPQIVNNNPDGYLDDLTNILINLTGIQQTIDSFYKIKNFFGKYSLNKKLKSLANNISILLESQDTTKTPINPREIQQYNLAGENLAKKLRTLGTMYCARYNDQTMPASKINKNHTIGVKKLILMKIFAKAQWKNVNMPKTKEAQ